MKKTGLILLCLCLIANVYGQRNNKKAGPFNKGRRTAEVFLQKQWWLGFKAGPNLSRATPETSYAVISPVNYTAAGREYKDFRHLGTQATFEVTFAWRNISASFQPTYRINRFAYSNHYEWTDAENGNNHLLLDYAQEQKISYLDLPLIVKYEFIISKVRPYAQVGIYTATLLDASKSLRISGVDHASGGINTFENEPIIVGATDLFAKYHWGIIAGGGINYTLGNVLLNLDVAFKAGMSNIANTQNRYGSDRLSGVGDSLDDMKLTSAAVSVGCLFPLRFLGSGFKSMID